MTDHPIEKCAHGWNAWNPTKCPECSAVQKIAAVTTDSGDESDRRQEYVETEGFTEVTTPVEPEPEFPMALAMLEAALKTSRGARVEELLNDFIRLEIVGL